VGKEGGTGGKGRKWLHLTFSFFWTKVAVLVLEEATIVALRFCFLDPFDLLDEALLELEDFLALFALVSEEGMVLVEIFTFSSS